MPTENRHAEAFLPPATANKPTISTPSLAVIALNRLGYGPRPGEIDAFNALGATDEDRISAWLDEQLNPGEIDDNETDIRVTNGNFYSATMSSSDIFQQFHRNYYNGTNGEDGVYYGWRPMEELQRLTLLRAIHSKRQIHEMMVNFWHDHFSVQGWEYVISSMIMPMNRDVIQVHALGNFRTLLEEVAKSPAMLYYLDNYTNSASGPNENFARELFELHTLGEENYLGSNVRQFDVEGFPDPLGYVDDDVYEATRAFTGWTYYDQEQIWDVELDTGEFVYRSGEHDRFQKIVLGEFISANQADMADGQQVFDRLVSHPGTARHIAGKLCRRFVSDTPPQSLIDSTAALFTQTIDAPDQIAQLIRHIGSSTQFATTWGEKLKRPFHAAVSIIRALDLDLPIVTGEDPANALAWLISRAGHEIMAWPAPDGYPDNAAYWLNSNSLFQRWFIAVWAATLEKNGGGYYFNILSTPDDARTATTFVDYWVERLLGYEVSAASRQQLIDFMADGASPDATIPLNTRTDARERAMSLTALVLMTPEAQWK